MNSYQTQPGTGYAVTPSDTVDLPNPAKYLLVCAPSGGDVAFKITTVKGNDETIPSLPGGQYYWGEVKRVWATGLTGGATIIAFY